MPRNLPPADRLTVAPRRLAGPARPDPVGPLALLLLRLARDRAAGPAPERAAKPDALK